jgi:hypothetical protein
MAVGSVRDTLQRAVYQRGHRAFQVETAQRGLKLSLESVAVCAPLWIGSERFMH